MKHPGPLMQCAMVAGLMAAAFELATAYNIAGQIPSGWMVAGLLVFGNMFVLFQYCAISIYAFCHYPKWPPSEMSREEADVYITAFSGTGVLRWIVQRLGVITGTLVGLYLALNEPAYYKIGWMIMVLNLIEVTCAFLGKDRNA